MINIVSYSGGVGSAITAKHIADKYGTNGLVLLFADTLIEDDDLYRFNDDVSRLIGVSITRISAEKTPWQIFEDVKYIGNTRVDPCSKYLKRDLIRNYLKANYHYDECQIWIGIDCSEEHRLLPVVEKNLPYKYRSYLIEHDLMLTNDDKKAWCKKHDIKVPRLYSLGFAHNNCGGFCVKAGQAQFAKLLQHYPERYAYHEFEQERIMNDNKNLRPFLRKTINGKLHYLTLKQFREDIENGFDSLDFGGCGCALE